MSSGEGSDARPEVAAWTVSARDTPQASELYRTAIRDWYDVSDIATDRPFFTDNRIYQFGDYVIGRGRSVGQTLLRGPEEIRRSGLDNVAMMLDLAGMTGDADGRDINTAPGSLHLRDLTRPTAFRVDAVDAIMLTVPRNRAPAWLLEPGVHGLSLEGTSQISRLLTGQLMALLETGPKLSVQDGVTSIEAVLVLAERGFRDTGALTATQTEAVYRRLRTSAVTLIERRLHEPDLKIDQLTRALGASRATLFRAFAASGGINLYIRQRRLDRAREALRLREGRSPSVAEIARAHGFSSESHFSRSFQERFGHRPGALQAAPPAPTAGASGGMRYDLVLDWIGGRQDQDRRRRS